MLLDLSAAFDTVDHDTLIRRLQASYGLRGLALNWFRSLQGRVYSTCGLRPRSRRCQRSYSAYHRAVFGPILFLLYTADLFHFVNSHGLQAHFYADDTQVYDACCPAKTTNLQTRLSVCVDDVASWMSANRWQNLTSTQPPVRQVQRLSLPRRARKRNIGTSMAHTSLNL